MVKKPTYEELVQRVKELENEAADLKRTGELIGRLNRLKEDLLSYGFRNYRISSWGKMVLFLLQSRRRAVSSLVCIAG